MEDDTKQTRADEAGRPISDGVASGMSRNENEAIYWGILCRACSEPVAFDVRPFHLFGLGSVNARPGAIRCTNGHNYIYFPRDFRFFPSAVSIADAAMQENREVYRAVNPPPDGSANSFDGVLPAAEKKESVIPISEPGVGRPRQANHLPDARREAAQTAAKDRWATWAIKKAM